MGRKIKIVRIINRFNLGGPIYNAVLLSRFMGEEFETTLIGGLPEKEEKDSLHIVKEYGVQPIIVEELRRSINLFRDIKAYREIKKIIKKVQPDIVHTHASKAGFLGRMAAFSLHVPVVLHTFHGHVFHSYFGKVKTEIFKKIERYLAKKSTGIIAISPLQKKELVHQFKISTNEKIKVIPLGFDLQKFTINKGSRRGVTRAKYHLQEEEIAIAIVGRLAPIKDHFYFLNVVEQLLEKTKVSVKVFIVGDGMEREKIQRKTEEINQKYPNTISMTSWVLDIASFNHGMDIICLTSKNEGTPVSIIEAQVGGIPVVSTDVGGVRDIIEEGKSGYVIKRENIETYVDKLRLLVENSALRKEFSTYGKKSILEKFSYEKLVKEMGNYYKSLLRDEN